MLLYKKLLLVTFDTTLVFDVNLMGLSVFGFRHEVDENCSLRGYYASSSGNFLPTFRNNLSVPSFRDQESKIMKGRPETLVWNYHYSLRNNQKRTVLMEPVLPRHDGACFTKTFDVIRMGTFSPWDLVKQVL